MTTSAPRLTPAQAAELAERTRYRVIGALLLLLGLLGYALFANGVDGSIVSTFRLNTGAGALTLPDWVLPSAMTVNTLSAICLFLGGFQLAKGFGRYTNTALGVAILCFILAFLTWATRDAAINLTGMLRSALLKAVPLTLGALSGILAERAGVVNIAIEGMMLSAAMVAALAGSLALKTFPADTYGELNMWIGLLAALLTGAALAMVHAVLSIHYKVNQIISGVVINIFASGLTSFLSAKFLQVFQTLNNPGIFNNWEIPGLVDLPLVGGIVFDNNLFVFGMLALLGAVHVALFYTRWGLRTRAVGEHPKAADTLGVNVFRIRYLAVLLSGLMAGFAGGYYVLGSVGRFDELMTAGDGFIALAAMIFGKWTPFGAFGASLIFGFASSLQGKLAILQVPIPSQFLLMAPYIATMIALAGLVGRATPPAADGQPYEKQ
jgi:simple sugar transport system permease protein